MPAVNVKEVWDLLTCAAEAATRKVDGESAVAVDAIVEAALSHYPQLTPFEVKLARHAAFDLSRFAALCDGAFQGYCSCFKRNGGHRAAMYLVAYLLLFQYHSLGEATVCALLNGCMPAPRLYEYMQYLFTANLVAQFSGPLWRTTYDDLFIQQQVMVPLAAAARDAAGDAAGWMKRHVTRPVGECSPDVAADEPAKTPRPPIKKESRPPQLRTSTRPRLPPYEVREMALTVPEPRLPRIKDAPLPSRPHATKAPTKPTGFSFHQRDAATAELSSSTNVRTGTAAAAASAKSGASSPEETTPRPSSSQLRRMLSAPHTVPTTTAALRREACMRDRQRAQADQALTEMEVVARDATAYELWRQSQEEEEERAREMHVMQRHLEAIETEERVRAQRAQATEARRRRFKNLRTKYQEELDSRRLEEEAARRQQEESVQQQRAQQLQDRVAALEKSSAAKAAVAAQVKQESEELRAAAQEAKEERQTQQALLIQDIHVMRQRIKEQQARLGEERRRAWADGEEDAALGRMSVAELRAALERMRADAEAEMEARHDHVTAVRSRAQAERDRLEDACATAREQQRQQRRSKQAQQAQHKATVEAERTNREMARMLQLHEKLEAKRHAARKVQRATREAERRRRNELLLRAQDSTSMEQRRWNDYEAGLVRRSKWEQQRTLQEAQK